MSRPSGRTTRRLLVGLAILAGAALTADRPGVAGGPPDRLDQFRRLALSRPSLWQADADAPADAYREMYALLDEEIVESLGTGGLFASPAFLQDRLDAFSEAWGAAAVGVVRVGRFVVGAFQMSDAPGINSVRVYGRLGGEAALLTTFSREGRPTVFPWAPAPNGVPQFVAAWEGPASGRGTRALRFDLVRQQGDGVRVVWSSTDVFPGGLMARAYSVRGEEIRVRYELHYPGWTPGCEGQTEAEDVFLPSRESGAIVRKAARQLNAWHRELRTTVAQVFAALAADDQSALARLVADAELRRRLPPALRPEPACDAVDSATNPHAVSIAATADQTPWALTFERAGARWRLTGARPVLE
ncbi:MAG: hypothetical protein DME04_13630 [Candidatus Rokuibacteriota bacterium]|nr:MAG: hypothetical protein DME04_13630 [Candidatus Rokubacteria bacterium]